MCEADGYCDCSQEELVQRYFGSTDIAAGSYAVTISALGDILMRLEGTLDDAETYIEEHERDAVLSDARRLIAQGKEAIERG